MQVETADHGRAERLLERGDGIETDELAVLRTKIDLGEVGGLVNSLARLDADVVALAVTGFVVVLGDVDPPVSMLMASATSCVLRLAAAMRRRSGWKTELRQVELQVGVDAASAGSARSLALKFSGEAPDLPVVFAGEHELQRFAALGPDHRVRGGEGACAGDLGQLLAQDRQQFLLRDLAPRPAPCVRRRCPG